MFTVPIATPSSSPFSSLLLTSSFLSAPSNISFSRRGETSKTGESTEGPGMGRRRREGEGEGAAKLMDCKLTDLLLLLLDIKLIETKYTLANKSDK